MSPVSSSFAATLDRYCRATSEAVHHSLADRQPDRHLYEPLRRFTTGGPRKSLRPALCLAACEASGGSMAEALPSAVAVELLHAGFLIHDDIEDGSMQRRGRAALHVEHGVPIALNVGDALAVLSMRPLLDNVELLGSRMARTVFAEFQLAMERTVEGQAVELGWRADNVLELTPLDYLDMILLKTCAYTTMLPLRVGALIGSWGSADLDALSRFGFALGAAFQIRDDVLDLVSSADSYAKDLLGDLREGKRTLALIHLLRSASPDDHASITAFLARPVSSREPEDARHIRLLMDRYCSIDFANQYATEMAAEATDGFERAFSACRPSPALDFLRDIVPFMVDRAA